ncbi:MAG TPA: hypothetical protein VGO45_11105 [Bacteroidia bacterium]|jgi:hypothetical protein|nr:hypothetical protein [Bacteroidia bacterium]
MQVRFLLLLLSICLLTACGGNHPAQIPSGEKDSLMPALTAKNQDTLREQYRHLIWSVPLSFDLLQKLSLAGTSYKAELLNPVSSVSRYNQTNTEALNLGVYGADMTYLISLGEFREFASHVRVIKQLTDALGVSSALDDDVLARFSDRNTNKDTLQNGISKSYRKIDKTLESNDRLEVAALVVCGGWIEGLYLSSSSVVSGGSVALRQLLSEQKKHLPRLIRLMSYFKSEPFSGIEKDLQSIQKAFESAKDPEHPDLSELKNISSQIEQLRARIIQ